MYGAIIGDIVGSRFEFNNIKTKKFMLFTDDSRFTDDTVMTIAVADICNSRDFTEDNVINTFKKWGRRYPNAGYGGHFYNWVLSDDREPYYSCGNGSAMRVSPVALIAETEDEVIELATAVTKVTHNHPEGIKGAVVTAMMIFKALHGATKDELYEYATSQYPEILKMDYEELISKYYHGKEICQVTVPQALYCFLISTGFEDCIRTTISIGGDCDTTSAISCAIAEAYYRFEISHAKSLIYLEVFNKLPNEMVKVLNKLYNEDKYMLNSQFDLIVDYE